MKRLIVIALIAVFSMPAFAERKSSVAAAFKRTHACPATSKSEKSCPGYVVDHVRPLCAGGKDAVTNMQWQSKEEALAKDRVERNLCRAARAENK